MNPSFTPGPWTVVEDNDGPEGNRTKYFWIEAPQSEYHPVDYEWAIRRIEDAHLIAAAPELYEALELVIGSLKFDREDAFSKEVVRRVKSALAKARGEAA